MPKRTYGEILGFPPGSSFSNRTDLAKSQVYRPNQGGICGGADDAESIDVSGGYVDDEDYGDEIVYTGQGGNHPSTKRQIADQKLTLGNLGLARSQLDGNPVRMIRGAGGEPKHSPAVGLRYDGLFRVVDHWTATGIDGIGIWRYRLVTFESVDAPPRLVESQTNKSVPRVEATIQRLVRSTAVAIGVKRLHDYTCQACRLRLVTPGGPYAEAARIRPLGKPHNGPDVPSNIFCLCPSHHLPFDAVATYIDHAGQVLDAVTGTIVGDLRLVKGHPLDWTHLE
ncbi:MULTISPECIES: YDG/SRA domain-containing protein [unclassified Micromonospora]|uniref:YDG/SRA domain-containing protein n=1 Tax=unclassified Micromonospora TaxID=2617518 RepID=UPI0003EED05A|nr:MULTISPECIES: YDG/SRA domain-containing protein [unclassified Micromonospora]EWM67009.1 YDG/SRA domain protein [Micromonospora sp. M42]MCK1807075.1 SRA-YDG domain-containing protein [Micromonospora sp. R42106]MCK1831778.1 SRA-YDG domain-containing protein [Micromonospora sp. R42003]MCK1844514.1 SRA-YDG domain-containing protein [Micromonospora sp. R42004]MCM1016902.1 SRA-YDG domain-containing protein [Micromonospora sp. XM-20-01]